MRQFPAALLAIGTAASLLAALPAVAIDLPFGLPGMSAMSGGEAHSRPVVAVAYSKDGKLMATGGGPTINIWDAKENKLLRTLKKHRGDVLSLAFSPDGSRLASGASYHGADSANLKLWDPNSGELKQEIQASMNNIEDVAFSPDGKTVACPTYGGFIATYDAATGQEKGKWKAKTQSPVYSPDGKLIASCNIYDVELLDAATGKVVRTLKRPRTTQWSMVAFLPDGKTLVSLGSELVQWDVKTGKELQALNLNQNYTGLAISPDGKLALISNQAAISLLELKSGKILKKVTPENKPPNLTIASFAFSPDGKSFVAPNGKEAKSWSVAD